jgi:hypothetical protein
LHGGPVAGGVRFGGSRHYHARRLEDQHLKFGKAIRLNSKHSFFAPPAK